MMNADITSLFPLFEKSLKELLSRIRKAKIGYIKRKDIQDTARSVSQTWFQEFSPVLNSFGIPDNTKKKYDESFKQLLGFSTKGSASTSYTSLLDDILRNFHEDISIPIWQSGGKGLDLSTLYNLMSLATKEEQDFLTEAVGCAKNDYLRAATILIWSASVFRMQKIVEKTGFDIFSAKSGEMKNIDTGRYKRFKKSFDIHNFTELEMQVFDTDLLWVLEYMGFIDGNQHDRLGWCFTLRSNSAHPGEAKVSPENFLSFCSDVNEFVFTNPKFAFSKKRETMNTTVTSEQI